MNMKKFAVRGLILLAVVIALCMFFSQTVRTITTAKVRLYSPRQGRMQQTVELVGRAVFPESEPVKIESAQDVTFSIGTVRVSAGYQVAAGDLLFTASVTDYERTMQALKDSYDQANTTLSTLLQTNSSLRLRRTDTEWAEAYALLTDAREAELSSRIAVQTLLTVEDLALLEDGTLPEGASDELRAAHAQLETDQLALSQAEEKMAQAERYSMDETTRAYITEKQRLERQLEQLEQQMLDLSVLQKRIERVTAPADGFITEINVRAGETFDPSGAAYSFCPADQLPVLRVDTEESELTISRGTEVTFESARGRELESEIVSTGVTVEGRRYADVELTERLIENMGGSYAIVSQDTTVNVFYRAQANTTLLPSSAVRGSGEDRYVYVAQDQQSAFGANSKVIAKVDVTVLAEIDGVCSIEEELSWYSVAYMEDRAISEGTTVMEYVN